MQRVPDNAAELILAEMNRKENALAAFPHAFQHGIHKAAKEARGQGAFFLDAFHDALTDKLYQEFKKRKLLK